MIETRVCKVLEEGVVAYFRKDGQLAADCCIKDFTPGVSIGFTRHGIAYFRGFQVGQLPAEALAKVGWREVIGIVALGHHGRIWLARRSVIVIDTDQDNLLKSRMKGKL